MGACLKYLTRRIADSSWESHTVSEVHVQTFVAFNEYK
jgi:hypothetical protein